MERKELILRKLDHNLYHKLEAYAESDYYPFHMPGHKRNMRFYPMKEIYKIDITEIDGFDNLHHAEGVLYQAMKKASTLYHAEETHFLVNGSTSGILSSISASVKRGGKILIARNSHKAAYNAIMLRDLQAIYLYPKLQKEFAIWGGINPKDVEEALELEDKIEAVFITSPTYDGIVSDVKSIAKIVHRKNIPLIVDEAHGAHFGFHPAYPQNSNVLGADIVIHSVHKSLPAFTQTALIHINGNLIDRNKMIKYLEIYQTSSPSYVFMSGIENCLDIISSEGNSLFQKLHENVSEFQNVCKKLCNLKVVERNIIGSDNIFDYDDTKVMISLVRASLNGKELYDRLLHEYHIQMEMSAPLYVLGITSIMDTHKGFQRLSDALIQIDQDIQNKVKLKNTDNTFTILEEVFFLSKEANVYCSIAEIENLELESISFTLSENRVSGEFVFLYPPGIPILVPGEIITAVIKERILAYRKRGFMLQGLCDKEFDKIKVVKKKKSM